jgi:hypothetical protein
MRAKHMGEACALLGIEPQSLAAAQGGAPVGMGQVQAVVCGQLGLAEQELRSALAAGAQLTPATQSGVKQLGPLSSAPQTKTRITEL